MHSDARLRKEVTLGLNVTVATGATIGRGSQLHDGSGAGENTVLRSDVTVLAGYTVPDNAVIPRGATVPDGATEQCTNGADDDGDSLVDCEDIDCYGEPTCGELVCDDGFDDDGDGDVDCEDADCWGLQCHPDGTLAWIQAVEGTVELTKRRVLVESIGGTCADPGFYTGANVSFSHQAVNVTFVQGKVRVACPDSWPCSAVSTSTGIECDWSYSAAVFAGPVNGEATVQRQGFTVHSPERCRLNGSDFLPAKLFPSDPGRVGVVRDRSSSGYPNTAAWFSGYIWPADTPYASYFNSSTAPQVDTSRADVWADCSASVHGKLLYQYSGTRDFQAYGNSSSNGFVAFPE